jgi:hypothetical protein
MKRKVRIPFLTSASVHVPVLHSCGAALLQTPSSKRPPSSRHLNNHPPLHSCTSTSRTAGAATLLKLQSVGDELYHSCVTLLDKPWLQSSLQTGAVPAVVFPAIIFR